MDANELVRRYILRQFAGGFEDPVDLWLPERNAHLAECPDIEVAEAEANDARFWDTGVTGVEFTAVITCPHGERQEFEFGVLGTLPDILADMERDESGGYL